MTNTYIPNIQNNVCILKNLFNTNFYTQRVHIICIYIMHVVSFDVL